MDPIGTLYKLVFMKQYNVDENESAMVKELADRTRRTRGLIVPFPSGTEFVVYPMWGIGARSNATFGIFYQHWNIEQHCNIMSR